MPLNAMPQDSQPNSTQTHVATVYRWPSRRRIPLRRRKPSVIRLGGKSKPRRGMFLLRMMRRIRIKWLKLHYSRILQRLKEYYRGLMKDLMDASATIEMFQQRLIMETSFAVPVMGVSLSSFPSVAGSNRPRTSVFM